MLSVMHYFAGGPFKRLEALQQGWGVPMPDANQWRIADACDDFLDPATCHCGAGPSCSTGEVCAREHPGDARSCLPCSAD